MSACRLVSLVVLLVCFGLQSCLSLQVLPDALLQGLTHSGAETLASEIQKLEKAYNDSVASFIPINKTCNHVVKTKIDACRACVTSSCEKRAKSACKPAEWQLILAKGIQFFSKDIPHFFSATLKGVFVDGIGGAVVNVGHELENVFAHSIPNVAINVGKLLTNSVVNVGKTVGNAVVDAGKTIGNGVVDVGKTIGNGVVDVGKDIGHEVSHIFHSIGHIFGKRATSEPSCDAIQNDSSKACAFYIGTCTSCQVDPNKDCSGYSTAVQKVKDASNARAWLAKATEFTYQVKSVSLDPAKFDPTTQGYKGVHVTLIVLGKTLTFTLTHPVNPYNPVTSGPAIALQALQIFKSA